MSEDTGPMPAHPSDGSPRSIEETPQSASTADRARELRAALGVRRQAESLLAEATEARMRAVAEADRTMAEAEVLAAELVDDARREADALVARARAEIEAGQQALAEERAALRAEVLAELDADVDEQARRVATLLDTTAADLRGLRPALEGALAVIAGAQGALESLRSECGAPETGPDRDQAPATTGESAGTPRVEAVPDPPAALPAATPGAVPGTDGSSGSTSGSSGSSGSVPGADDGPRPLGWLFRAQRG